MEWPLTLEQEHVEGCRAFANRNLLIEFHAPQIKGGKIAEIGVEYGYFSEFLLKALQPQMFHAYDLFNLHEYETHRGNTKEILGGKRHFLYYTRKFSQPIYDGRFKAYMGDSSACLAEQPDHFYDMIYVDGDHTIEGVKKDTAVAVRKIKPDGLLVFNDYIMWDCVNPWTATYGVVQAVNDLCVNHGWRMVSFAFQSSMFCDVALVKKR